MNNASYHFITHWRLQASKEEIYDILGDAAGLARWWPSVYLDVKVEEPGDEAGVRKLVKLYTKGWLPYTLTWSFRVISADKPNGFTIVPYGDFTGRGIWLFQTDPEDPSWCHITYDWKIEAAKPFLKKMTFLLRPLFSANHHWAMKKGEESLALEILRRRTAVSGQILLIPSPPKPTYPHNRKLNKVF
jgi:hypothetical protein